MRKRLDGVALEESEEEAASRSNAAGEFAQNRWQFIRGKVDNGVPRKNCNCVSVSDPEIVQKRDAERDRRNLFLACPMNA